MRPKRAGGRTQATVALQPALLMEGDFGADVDVRQAVAVGHAERLARVQVLAHLQQPAAGHGLLAGVHQRDLPRLAAAIVVLDPVLPHVEGHVRLVQEVVREVLLHDVTLVAEAHDEIPDAERCVGFHDVPQDGTAPDLDHGLRPDGRFFGDSGALAAREDHAFHRSRYSQSCASVNASMFCPAACARYQSAVQASDSARFNAGRQPSVRAASADDSMSAPASV